MDVEFVKRLFERQSDHARELQNAPTMKTKKKKTTKTTKTTKRGKDAEDEEDG